MSRQKLPVQSRAPAASQKAESRKKAKRDRKTPTSPALNTAPVAPGKPGAPGKSGSSGLMAKMKKKLQQAGRNGGQAAQPDDESQVDESGQSAVTPQALAETRFFGIQAQGSCFAFILDISLSMEGERLEYCKRELIQALNNLPEHAAFGIFLYADTVYTPSGQKDWLQANRAMLDRIISWVARIGVKPYTRPGPAFKRAFSYSTAPGVIFFLTDGELFNFTAGECASITGAGLSITKMVAGLFTNRKPKSVPVIHTIGLGDEAGKGVLQQIANDHGGTCRVIT